MMKQVYKAMNKYLKLDEEGNTLFKYLMDYNLLETKFLKRYLIIP